MIRGEVKICYLCNFVKLLVSISQILTCIPLYKYNHKKQGRGISSGPKFLRGLDFKVMTFFCFFFNAYYIAREASEKNFIGTRDTALHESKSNPINVFRRGKNSIIMEVVSTDSR